MRFHFSFHSFLLQARLLFQVSRIMHTTIRGPKLPMTKLHRMAGLWRAAQVMYLRGAPQNVTGAMAIVLCVVCCGRRGRTDLCKRAWFAV